jgi:hypothetical protein
VSAQRFHDLLHDLSACAEATRWAEGKDLHEVWTTCDRGDWGLWLAGRMCGAPGWHTRQQIVLAACACAETALKYVKVGEDRPRLAIETARAWARGEVNIEDVRRARTATYAAYAAYADAADAAAYAAAAAAAAADAAAWAADAAAARAIALAECAAIVRRELPEPQWGEKEVAK